MSCLDSAPNVEIRAENTLRQEKQFLQQKYLHFLHGYSIEYALDSGLVCKSQPIDGRIRDSRAMKQMRFAHTGFELVTKRARKREFLDEMNLVIPYAGRPWPRYFTVFR